MPRRKKITWADLKVEAMPLLKRFDPDPEIDDEKRSICVSTRDGGDIGAETPGTDDIKRATRLGQELEARWSNVYWVVDTCDEWTSLDITWYPRRLPTPPPSLEKVVTAFAKLMEGTMPLGWSGRPSTSSRASYYFTRPNKKSRIGLDSICVTACVHPPGRAPQEPWHLVIQVGRHSVAAGGGKREELRIARDELRRLSDGWEDTGHYLFRILQPDGRTLRDPTFNHLPWDFQGWALDGALSRVLQVPGSKLVAVLPNRPDRVLGPADIEPLVHELQPSDTVVRNLREMLPRWEEALKCTSS